MGFQLRCHFTCGLVSMGGLGAASEEPLGEGRQATCARETKKKGQEVCAGGSTAALEAAQHL